MTLIRWMSYLSYFINILAAYYHLSIPSLSHSIDPNPLLLCIYCTLNSFEDLLPGLLIVARCHNDRVHASLFDGLPLRCSGGYTGIGVLASFSLGTQLLTEPSHLFPVFPQQSARLLEMHCEIMPFWGDLAGMRPKSRRSGEGRILSSLFFPTHLYSLESLFSSLFDQGI